MKKGLITSILALTFTGLQAHPLPNSPQLVVTLTIDQLRTDYLEAFSSLYGERGFKRLMREGKVYRQVEYPFNKPDRASAIATLFTGSTPSLHGIISNSWLDDTTLRPKNCVEDPAFMGNYTDETSSATHLLTSTVADELKIGTQNRALVYSIAPQRDAAILAAGHAGNAAFWLNAKTGKWCSTTYYKEFPWWMSEYNSLRSPDFRIRGLEWSPVHPVSSYRFLPDWRTDAFKHQFSNDRTNQYRRLIASPFINDEINLLTEELLSKSTLGKDEIPDMLALSYYAGNYNHRSILECAMEMQDTYVRLDRSIANLLDMLDKHIGLSRIIFCIASTGYSDPESTDIGTYRIPGGEFHLNRCATLLNMFLMATYGEGQYVEGYHKQHIYLNHKLIEDKGLLLADVQEKAAQFLMQFSGVNEVYSANRLLLGAWTPQIEKIRNGFHRKNSGDLLIDVLPGWTIMQENSSYNRVVRAANLTSPIMLLGAGIQAETISTPVSSDRLAPTLTHILRIRAPNACQAQPLF